MLNRVLQQFRLPIKDIYEVEDSFSSTVFKCTLANGENVFLKIPFSKLKFNRELEAYEILKGNVAIPELLDVWAGDEECVGAFLLSELTGEPLTTEVTPRVAYEVGVLHGTMHSIRPPEDKVLKGIENEFSGWGNFLEEKFYSFAEDAKHLLDASLLENSLEKFEEMKKQLPPPDGPSFVHMDFRPANIIVEDDKVSGVIDFESVRFGSTEIDFTKLHRDFLSYDARLFSAYKEGYNSIRPLINLDVVLPFYQFTDAFNSIGWCQRRGALKNANFLKQNLAILKKWVQ